MMLWQPIKQNELELMIEQELREMPSHLRERFSVVRIPIHPIACKRRSLYGEAEIEKIFVVAQHKHKIIVFDDVEDMFAIADTSQQDGDVLQSWILFGELEIVLRELY